jgi:Flp pilus assembly protein TadD
MKSAIASLFVILTLAGCSESSRQDGRTDPQLLASAEHAMKTEDYGEALKAMNVLVERSPTNFIFLSGRAMILAVLGRADEAGADFDRCVALDDKEGKKVRFFVADRLVWKGRHLAATKQPEKALVLLDVALQLFPKSGNTYHDRGAVKMDLGDYRGAAKDFTLAIENDEGNNRFGDSYLLRSRAKEKLGDTEGAKGDKALSEKQIEQDGAANGSQPIRSETNTTSSAAGSPR